MKRSFCTHEHQRFSIRKYSFGAASVLLGASLVLGGTALADEQAQPVTDSSASQAQVVNQEQATNDQTVASTEVSDQEALAPASDSQSQTVASSEATSDALASSEATTSASQASTQSESALATADQAPATVSLKLNTTSFTPVSNALDSSLLAASKVAVNKTVATADATVLASQGAYTYTEQLEIKNEPKLSAKTEFFTKIGDTVYYDQVVTADGYQWISYKSNSGVRRYVPIQPQTTGGSTPGDKDLPAQGRYTLTEDTDVKNSASASAPVEFTLDKGYAFNYDKVVEADGYKWLSYMSNSGTRRYVPVTKLATQDTTPKGTLSIDNHSNGDFTVVITNVTDLNGVKKVQVPVWTEKSGQDDIIWYDAAKQSDGSYKVDVKLSDHKNERGAYNVHLYYVENNGKQVGVATTKTTVAEPSSQQSAPTGKIAIEKTNANGFTVIVSDVSDDNGVKTVRVPVWTEKAGQDDIIWYDATKQSDGTYKVDVKLSDHKNERGDYNVHLYYVENSGKQVGVATTKTTVAEPSSPVSSDNQENTGAIKLPAQGRYTFTRVTDIKLHPKASEAPAKRFGKGDNLYYEQVLEADGHQWLKFKGYDMVYYYADIAKLSNTVVSDSAQSSKPSDSELPAQGTYQFTKETAVKNKPSQAAPTEFTYDKGQSVNYDQTLEADGHQWLSYISLSGVRRYVDLGANTKAQDDTVRGTVSIDNLANGDFTVVISDVNDPNGVKAVRVPVWTEKDGQDDIIWYDAAKQSDGSYKVDVKLSDHKNQRGDYNVHLYYTENSGKLVGVTTAKTTVKDQAQAQAPTGQVSFQQDADDKFTVIVSNVSDANGVKAVKLPVWTDNAGQDDIIWYDAAKQSDGTYKVDVKLSDHKNQRGLYNVHLYYTENSGKLVGVAATQVTVEQKEAPKDQVTGHMTIENKTATGFDVIISDVEDSNGLQVVEVPVWTENKGQDDLKWYQATKQANGDYKVSVDIKNHKNETGDYNIHLYYKEKNGAMRGVGTTMTNLSKSATTTATEQTQPSTAVKEYFAAQGHYGPVIIVNKKHPLAESYQPGENATAKAAFDKLRQAMKADGLAVGQAYTGYVSYADQDTSYQTTVATVGKKEADLFLARPGYDEHQTGLAFDLLGENGQSLDDEATSNWLANNADKFGFIVRYQRGKTTITGRVPEPWHLRYVGDEAKAIKASELSLEEYFDLDGGDYGTPRADEGKNSHVTDPAPVATEQTSAEKPASETKPASDTKPSSATKTASTSSDQAAEKFAALPAQGTYTFTKEVPVKNQASQAAPTEFTFEVGESINYDKTLEADGRKWVSYVSFGGTRRYVDITDTLATRTATPASSQAVTIPEQGSYTFSKRASIKSEPKMSAPELAYYDAGQSVNYDGVLKADGHQWISYLSYQGKRRYIAID